MNNEEWFDIVSDFGKTLNKFASAEKTRCLINSLKNFLSSSEHPSDLLDILSYSLKDPSFKTILIDSNIKLIEKANADSNNIDLLKVKVNLTVEKQKIYGSIDRNEMMFFLFPGIFPESNDHFEKNSYSKNTNWQGDYNEYLDMTNQSLSEYDEDYQGVYPEQEDFETYDEYSPYQSESDRMIDEYGEDGFEAGDTFFPESWSPE